MAKKVDTSVIVPNASSDFVGQPIWFGMPTPGIETHYDHVNNGIHTPDYASQINFFDQNKYDRLEFYDDNLPEDISYGDRIYIDFVYWGMKLAILEPGILFWVYTDYPSQYSRQIAPTWKVNINTFAQWLVGGIEIECSLPYPSRDELSRIAILYQSVKAAGAGTPGSPHN